MGLGDVIGGIIVIIFAFPVALIFPWAFEIKPEGIKRAGDIDLLYRHSARLYV